MASNYTGNPTAAQSPGQQPYPGNPPTSSLPADGDADNGASVAQALKEPLDYVAYLMEPGRRRLWQENYDFFNASITSSQVPITAYPSLAANINGAGSSANFTNTGDIGVIAGLGMNTAVLTAGGTNLFYATVSSPRAVYNRTGFNATQICFEQDLAIANVANGNYWFGITDSTTALTNFAGVKVPQGGGAASLITAAGTVSISGSAFTNNVSQRMKIVYYGSATPKGIANANTALVEVYLGNATSPTATQSGAFETAGGPTFYAVQSAFSAGAGGALGYFGGWTISWNAY